MAYPISRYRFADHMRATKRASDLTPAQAWERRPEPTRNGVETTNLEVAEIVELVKRKLAWFGLRSVKIGPFVKVNDRAIVIDLLADGNFLCRIEVDRQSGAITKSGDDALSSLITSLQSERARV